MPTLINRIFARLKTNELDRELGQSIYELHATIESIRTENVQLKLGNDLLKQENARLTAHLESLTSPIFADPVVLDFEQMKAISVERMRRNDQAVTIVGYSRGNGEMGEWTLHCTAEIHEKLAAEFKAFIAARAKLLAKHAERDAKS